MTSCMSKTESFGKLSWRPRHITSLLWCSDMVYCFASGSVVGSVVTGLCLLSVIKPASYADVLGLFLTWAMR